MAQLFHQDLQAIPMQTVHGEQGCMSKKKTKEGGEKVGKITLKNRISEY